MVHALKRLGKEGFALPLRGRCNSVTRSALDVRAIALRSTAHIARSLLLLEKRRPASAGSAALGSASAGIRCRSAARPY
jgi:hypothetical protein